ALKEAGATGQRGRRGRRERRRARLGNQPMIWKEVFTRSASFQLPWFGRWTVRALVVVSVLPLFYIGYHFLEGDLDTPLRIFGGQPDVWEALAQSVNVYVVRVSGTAVACLLLVMVAVRSSSSVSLERDRQTLDGLLTTPMDSDNILLGKWLGAV